MLFKRNKDEPADKTCLVCGKREGTVKITGGYVCQYCVPINASFDNPTAEDVARYHIVDPEILERIEVFTETQAFEDLRFDDEHRLFFKGPWPSYCIPILDYSEIAGYRVVVDEVPLAFNNVSGQRALFKVTTDEYIKKACKEMSIIMLELDSSRPNIRFRPYEIRGKRFRVADSKQDCLRFAIDVAHKLDAIIEQNANCGMTTNE